MKTCMLVLTALPLALAASAAGAQSPKTPWGHPDLQGTWSNATLTPLQRPLELKDKEFFTAEEAKAYVKQRLAAQSGDENIEKDRASGNVGSYNDAWMDRGNDIVPTRRTSLIVEPENGRVPPFTPAAEREFQANLARAKEHPADTPEDRYLTERCIGFGGGHAPMLPEPYNNNYYIVQTPEYVTIMAELNHEVRIIPIDGRPHIGSSIHEWNGDSRARWEGDTLVVETANFLERGEPVGEWADAWRANRAGTKLVEQQIADIFKVSRTVVREVLRQLETEGLVAIIPHKGPVVRELSAGEARDLYTIRGALEGIAARLFVEHAGAEHVSAPGLNKLSGEINRILKQPDIVDKLAQQGVDPLQSTPESFGRHIKAETARFGKAVKESGARVD